MDSTTTNETVTQDATAGDQSQPVQTADAAQAQPVADAQETNANATEETTTTATADAQSPDVGADAVQAQSDSAAGSVLAVAADQSTAAPAEVEGADTDAGTGEADSAQQSAAEDEGEEKPDLAGDEVDQPTEEPATVVAASEESIVDPTNAVDAGSAAASADASQTAPTAQTTAEESTGSTETQTNADTAQETSDALSLRNDTQAQTDGQAADAGETQPADEQAAQTAVTVDDASQTTEAAGQAGESDVTEMESSSAPAEADGGTQGTDPSVPAAVNEESDNDKAEESTEAVVADQNATTAPQTEVPGVADEAVQGETQSSQPDADATVSVQADQTTDVENGSADSAAPADVKDEASGNDNVREADDTAAIDTDADASDVSAASNTQAEVSQIQAAPAVAVQDAGTDQAQTGDVQPEVQAVHEAESVPSQSETPVEEVSTVAQTVVPEPPAAIPKSNQETLAGNALEMSKLNRTTHDANAVTAETDFLSGVDQSAVSTSGMVILNNIQDYLVRMHPTKMMNKDEGSRNQVFLYRQLTNAINNLDEDFDVVFGHLLRAFREHKDTAMHPTRCFRFLTEVSLGEADRHCFRNLLNLFTLLHDPATRKQSLAQIDFGRSLIAPITDAGRTRVLNYFGS